MILTELQARELIIQPKNSELLKSVKLYESALRVFTEELDEDELTKEIYWTELTNKMKTRIDGKLKRVLQFMRFPLPIVQITDSILNDYFKVFEGKNRFFNVSASRDIQALQVWLSEVKPQDWIESQAREVLKNKPCSFTVIDRGEDGKPYLINIDHSRLIDADVIDKDGNCGYIVFVHTISVNPDDTSEQLVKYSVYDDETYYVFQKGSKSDSYTLISQNKHQIGHCPARMFVNTPSNSRNPFKRRVAFGPSISKLEDWTIFDIFRNYVDHYVPFPVTESAIKKCVNSVCKGGKIAEEEIIDRAKGTTRTKWSTCPVCLGKDLGSFMGPGSHIGIKLRGEKNLEDGSGKFKMHFPETDKMKYVPEKLDALELEIRYKTVGVSSILTKEAVNETQIKGSFASMESVLMRNKQQLDDLYKWIVSSVAKLLYKNLEVNVEANFGTEFYLISEEQLQLRFENAKKAGLPKSEQILIYEQLIDTKYKGNSDKILRQKMLLRLDPLPLYSELEAIEMFEKRAIDNVLLNFKINFYKFVTRFEDENTVITEFGSNLEYSKQIDIILTSLKNYNDENITSQQLDPSGEGTEKD